MHFFLWLYRKLGLKKELGGERRGFSEALNRSAPETSAVSSEQLISLKKARGLGNQTGEAPIGGLLWKQ